MLGNQYEIMMERKIYDVWELTRCYLKTFVITLVGLFGSFLEECKVVFDYIILTPFRHQ